MADAPAPAPILVVLCGRSFSGKSTLASRLRTELGATVVSLDDINAERGLTSGSGIPIEEWSRTMVTAHERAEASLSRGVSVIVDDTSSPRFLRDGWRELGARTGAQASVVYIDTPVSESVSRHAHNRATGERMDVTDEVLREHLATFEAPASDEHPILMSDFGDDTRALANAIATRAWR